MKKGTYHLFVLIGMTGGIPEIMFAHVEHMTVVRYLRAEAESMTADTKRSGCCTHTGKHYTEAVDFWAHGDIEMRIDSVEVQGGWFR